MTDDVRAMTVAKTLRVPAVVGPVGDGSAAARRLGVALMQAGFKMSGELLAHLSGFAAATVDRIGAELLAVAAGLVLQ